NRYTRHCRYIPYDPHPHTHRSGDHMARRQWAATMAALGLIGWSTGKIQAQTPGQPEVEVGASYPVALPPPSPPPSSSPPATAPLTVVPPTQLTGSNGRPAPTTGTPAPIAMLPATDAPADSSPKSLAGLEPTELEKLIDERLKAKLAEIEAKKKADAEKKAAEGTVVGDDLNMNVTWDWGGFRYKTADEAFSVHFGGRLMYDAVWWDQSPGLKRPATLPRTSPLFGRTGLGTGIGDLQDGFFIRRARVVGDGTIYQTVEFKVEFDFENLNSLTFDEMYVGMKDLPFIDAVR